MTTTFNAAATKTVGVNATNFEFTFTRLERIAFGPGKITTLGAELERMGATRALVVTGKTLGASPFLERVTAAEARFRSIGAHRRRRNRTHRAGQNRAPFGAGRERR
jgi:hypothetical protein